MTIIFIVSSILLGGFLFLNNLLKNIRLSFKNELRLLYSKLEFQFIKEDKIKTNVQLEFIKGYKTTSELTDLLDIQVLWAIHHIDRGESVHNLKEDFDKLKEELSEESKLIIEQFQEVSTKLFYMSFIRIDFLWWALKKFIKVSCISIVKTSFRPFIAANSFVKELASEANEIIISGEKKALTIS